MRPRLGIDVAAPSELAWAELVELDAWPRWGPTVRSARLDDGTRRLTAGATGSVQTSVGLWLPFRVDEWLLHVMDSPSAHGARGLVRGGIFTRDGRLVASTVQEGLIRRRPAP